jgi:hypothetical protein
MHNNEGCQTLYCCQEERTMHSALPSIIHAHAHGSRLLHCLTQATAARTPNSAPAATGHIPALTLCCTGMHRPSTRLPAPAPAEVTPNKPQHMRLDQPQLRTSLALLAWRSFASSLSSAARPLLSRLPRPLFSTAGSSGSLDGVRFTAAANSSTAASEKSPAHRKQCVHRCNDAGG